MRLLPFPRGTELLARPVEKLLESGSIADDLDRTYELGVERPLPFSPLDAVLGFDGSTARALDLVFWGAGDVVRRSFRGGSATGTVLAKAVAKYMSAHADDVKALEAAVVAFLGHEKHGPQVGADLDAALLEGLEALRRLVEQGTFVADYDTKVGATWGDLIVAFESDDLIALAAAETLALGTRDVAVNQCRNCQRPFVESREGQLYCARVAPNRLWADRTCREVGPQERYKATISPADALYRRSYKRLDNQVRRGQLSRAGVDTWRDRARDLVRLAKAESWPLDRVEAELGALEPGQGEG